MTAQDKIDELRKACRCLYLAVPEKVAKDISDKVEAVIADAEKDAFFIGCLEAGGVDNWEWFDESLTPYWERYG